MTDDRTLEERVAALEEIIAHLDDRLDTVANRDVPLLKGTVRTAIGAEIDDIGELPDAGRAFNRTVRSHDERLDAVERRLAALGEVGTETTTKEQKLAAICTFAQNKRNSQTTIAVTADEIQGCVGVSRRYAYDLIEEAAATIGGARVREARQVRTSTGVEQKKKALLVDCEAVHADDGAVKEFTTGGGDADGERADRDSPEVT